MVVDHLRQLGWHVQQASFGAATDGQIDVRTVELALSTSAPSGPQRRIWLTSEPSRLAGGLASDIARRRRRDRNWRTERLLKSGFVCTVEWSCVLIRYKTTTPPPLRQRILTLPDYFLERFHERGKLAQNLEC